VVVIGGLIDAGAEATLWWFGTLIQYVLKLFLLLAELIKVWIGVWDLMAMSLLFKCDATRRFSWCVVDHILTKEVIIIDLIAAVVWLWKNGGFLLNSILLVRITAYLNQLLNNLLFGKFAVQNDLFENRF